MRRRFYFLPSAVLIFLRTPQMKLPLQAALVQDTGEYAQDGFKAAGSYAFLTNNGTINLHYKDIAAAYADQLDIYGDISKKYDNIMGWGMLAGEYSTLINNGTINFYYDKTAAVCYFRSVYAANFQVKKLK